MRAIIEGIDGLTNTEDSIRRVKLKYGQDGSVELSGDCSKLMNFRPKKDRTAAVRNGQTAKLTGTAPHSLWCNAKGNTGLFVDATNLKLLNSDYTATALATVNTGQRMCYAEHNGQVFMGNGYQMKCYTEGGALVTWGDSTYWPSTTDPRDDWYGVVFSPPPFTNVIGSYRSRMWACDGRFALYSVETFPHAFRRAHNIPCADTITAFESQPGYVYLFSRDCTKVLQGLDPEDMNESELPIGAISHGAINVYGVIYLMTRYGWAVADQGQIKYLDDENFRLDLPATAEAYMWHDPVKREVGCYIRQ